MICITDIKIIKTTRDFFEKALSYQAGLRKPNNSIIVEDQEVTHEIVYGREFINANGDSVCIGMAENVQIAIGLPFEAFANMNYHIEKQAKTIRKRNRQIEKLNIQIQYYKNMNFLEKIKFIFFKKYQENVA